MAQTTVNEYRAAYVQGEIQNPATADTETRIVDGSDIQPGWAVIKGTNENDVTVPAAAFTKATFRGVAVWSAFSKEKALSTGNRALSDDEPITILRNGVIAVLLGGTVTEGGTAFFVHTTGGASTINTWRGDLDTDKASQVPGVFLEDGVAGEVVKMRLSFDAGLGSVLT